MREVTRPGSSGPMNGQYALQRALRRRRPAWLRIGGALGKGEIPWIWCWEDGALAARCARARQPLVAGPNLLFADSRRPCRLVAERQVCRAASCRLLFTESEWYRRLIERHGGPENRAPIVLWPYPIDPQPGGPLPAEHELLIYAKSGPLRLAERLVRRFPRSVVLHYGRFERQALFEAARRSRACVYLSDDDRGPLALAEILLAGCPAIGVATGAPFIAPGRTGIVLDRLDAEACFRAVAACHRLERGAVAAWAARQFDTDRIVETVLSALQRVAEGAVPRRGV
jgi:hypothetical protein